MNQLLSIVLLTFVHVFCCMTTLSPSEMHYVKMRIIIVTEHLFCVLIQDNTLSSMLFIYHHMHAVVQSFIS